MIASFKAELLKLRKRPATWILLGVVLGLTQLFGYVLPYSSWATSDQNFQTQGLDPQAVLAGTLPGELVPTSLGGFPVFAGALALILGALATGSEFGWGTMQTALTQRPARLAVYAGKLAALAASTLAVVLATFALNAAVAGVIATVESRALDYPTAAELARGIGSGWLIMGMWCGLGALLGLAFRGVALPVGLGVVWVLGVEGLVSAVAGSLLTSLQPLRDLLPGVNAGSLVWSLAPGGGSSGEAPPGVIDAVAGGRATLSLALYVAAFVAAGAVLMRRRDVT
ncbi:MAG TPA: ABC transporter permease subunit [Actinomycetota bacterium]|jgi:ABC-type transport system involved in multi-copper enzyme maturation permease subunit|nr:ABC transporter permease subunit [Actinomycetota bacterium]